MQARTLGFEHNSISFDWLEELVARNHASEGIWRLKIIVTAKRAKELSHAGTILATLEPFQWIPWESCNLCVFPHPIESPTAEVKSLSYLDHLQVRSYAQKRGYQDAVTTTAKGFILETGCSNIFWIDQGVLWIPDPDLPYLKGVFIQALLKHLSIPVQKVQATPEQIPPNASVYLCNCLTHVRPVLSIGSNVFQRKAEWESLLQMATKRAIGTLDSHYYQTP